MTVDEFIEEWGSDVPYIEAHTSGSTGTPKLIRLPKSLVAESARRSIAHFGLDASSRLHLCLSPDYIAGKMVIVRALLCGGALSVEAPASEPFAAGRGEGEVTLLSVVGAQVAGLEKRRAGGELPHIRHLLIGGAPLTETVAAQALGVAEHVWESYGMTETASHIALREIVSPEDVSVKPFRLLSGIEASLTPSGCLAIELPGRDKLVTNDVCRMRGEREFSVVGRADNVIITGGLKVHPEEVEKRIAPLIPHVGSFFIGSQPDAKWGSRVVLVLEGADLSVTEREELLQRCAEVTKTHEKPRDIICMSQLPRTSTGKIIRKL